MSKVEIDGVMFDVAPEVAGLLQAVSEERDELSTVLRSLCEIRHWMRELNVVSFDKYGTALHERFDAAERALTANKEIK
jgi:hypothetical protein